MSSTTATNNNSNNNNMIDYDNIPQTKLLIRSDQGTQMLSGPPIIGRGVGSSTDGENKKISMPVINGASFPHSDGSGFSMDGSLFWLSNSEERTITIIDSKTNENLLVLPGREAYISPGNTYILIWEKLQKGIEGSNVKLYHLSSQTIHLEANQKVFESSKWPLLKWNEDETICIKNIKNEIQIYDGKHIDQGVKKRISVPNVKTISLSGSGTGSGSTNYTDNNNNNNNNSTDTIKIAAFIPEVKGKAASVKVFDMNGICHASKSFFNADDCDIKWSPNNEAILIHTSAEVDTTGSSYDGASGLFLLHTNGEYDCLIAVEKKGPVYASAWAPGTGPLNFVVIAGTMPAQASLYNMKGDPVYHFGEAYRNTISFSPHGRFLCLAGFGNLPGGMDFWDRHKKRKMGTNESAMAVTHSWSPCGRYFLTGTLWQRMKTANAFKLFRYNGQGPLYTQDFAQLYDCKWQSSLKGIYPDRKASPMKENDRVEPVVTTEIKPVGVYKPPNRTANWGRIEREKEAQTLKAGKVTSSSSSSYAPKVEAYRAPGSSLKSSIPGMAPPPDKGGNKQTAAEKNKKRAEKKKREKEAKAKEEEEALKQKVDVPPPPPASTSTVSTADPIEKKIKKINKTLKQIDELKKKAADGNVLNDDQKNKLQSESTLLAELAGLTK